MTQRKRIVNAVDLNDDFYCGNAYTRLEFNTRLTTEKWGIPHISLAQKMLTSALCKAADKDSLIYLCSNGILHWDILSVHWSNDTDLLDVLRNVTNGINETLINLWSKELWRMRKYAIDTLDENLLDDIYVDYYNTALNFGESDKTWCRCLLQQVMPSNERLLTQKTTDSKCVDEITMRELVDYVRSVLSIENCQVEIYYADYTAKDTARVVQIELEHFLKSCLNYQISPSFHYLVSQATYQDKATVIPPIIANDQVKQIGIHEIYAVRKNRYSFELRVLIWLTNAILEESSLQNSRFSSIRFGWNDGWLYAMVIRTCNNSLAGLQQSTSVFAKKDFIGHNYEELRDLLDEIDRDSDEALNDFLDYNDDVKVNFFDEGYNADDILTLNGTMARLATVEAINRFFNLFVEDERHRVNRVTYCTLNLDKWILERNYRNDASFNGMSDDDLIAVARSEISSLL